MYLAVLVVWSALLIGVGWAVSRRSRSASGFFVAGRRLPGRLVFATVVAANIGAGSTVGATALGYEHGLAAWWWVGATGIGTLLLAVWLGPRMWRAASAERLRTVGDFLELRYGAPVRVALTGLLLVATLFVLAAQLLAAGVLVAEAADIGFVPAVLASGAVMIAYFAVGGLASAAWVNLVQLVVLAVGLGLAVPWALTAAGGTPQIEAALGDGALDVFRDGGMALSTMAVLVPAFLVSPGILQKLFGGRSAAAVRRGLLAAGITLLAFAAVPSLLGAAAAVLHPGLELPDAALPALLMGSLPVWLGCLGVVALFSAEVSSADAVLFMLSTSFSRDVYQRFLRPGADEAAVLRMARGAAVVGGLAAVVIAVLARSVIDAITIFYSILGIALFVPIVAGLHAFRPPGPVVLAGAGVGTAVFLLAPEGLPLPGSLLGIAASAIVVVVGAWMGGAGWGGAAGRGGRMGRGDAVAQAGEDAGAP